MTVTNLLTALDRARGARTAMCKPMRESAMAIALQMADERDALEARMEKRWRWCDANAGHAQFIEREGALLADIATYTEIEDALVVAANELLGEAS